MAGTDTIKNLMAEYDQNNAFAQSIGMHLEVVELGVVRYVLTVKESHLATPGFVHGGVLTTMLDATMGAGALTLVEKDQKVVSTIEMHVNFINPAKVGSVLTATSVLVRQGKKVIFMKAEMFDEHNKCIAVSSGTFYPFLAEKAGYKL
ncbi:MAG: PaaI family thioesterase [Flavobacteriia bacterium]|nr:PaaI family thioesterase [Flavobacteriia bacterium]